MRIRCSIRICDHRASCGLNSASAELNNVVTFCFSEAAGSDSAELVCGKWSSSLERVTEQKCWFSCYSFGS